MADFKTIKDLINQEVVTNGQGLIDAVLLRGILIGMLDAVGLNLDDKVDAVNGKSLILDTLITKLSNMPFITAYDYANHRVTLSDGTHSQVYQLTPYVPIPDYYIGWWTDGNTSSFDAFAALTGTQLANAATSYMKASQQSVTKTVVASDIVGSRQVFFIMWKDGSAPQGGIFYGGVSQETLTAASFTDDNVFNAQRNDVTIDGTTYHVAGMRAPFEIGNYFTINF